MTVGADPLLDTLFRSTEQAATALDPHDIADAEADLSTVSRGITGIASEPPVRAEGTRSRAGNSMPRTRAALIDGARQVVQKQGTRLSMSQVAVGAGVAKATLYNHFRTREAVLDALLADEIASVVSDTAELSLSDALAYAATRVSSSDLRAALARLEPQTLARLACITGGGWAAVRQVVQVRLGAAESSQTELALRWLASFLLSPVEEQSHVTAAVTALVHGLCEDGSGVSDAVLLGAGHR